MPLSWRERLLQQPSLMDMGNWPVVNLHSLPPEKRRQYARNRRMVAQALAQTPLNTVADRFNITPSLLTRLLNRALGGDEASTPPLTQALIPNEQLIATHRRKPLETLALPAGSAGGFQHLLRVVPGLKDYLDSKLRLSAQQAPTGQNLQVDVFHKAFLRFLREVGWPADTYPFTTLSQGYESLRQYFHHQLDLLRLPKTSHRVIAPTRKPLSIYQEIQIDEHTVHCQGSIVLVLNDQWQPLRIARVTLIAAREVASSTVLGALLVLNQSPSRDDLLAFFALLTRPWQPLPLTTPGLVYPPGASIPSALGQEFLRPAFGIIRFDNAMVHRANEVRDFVCHQLGATLNLGLPRYPLARALIEAVFKDLNYTIHRFPSTTGSHPTDPIREPAHRAKKPPVLSLRVLEEAIQVHMACLNHKPLGNLGAVAPIDMLREQMAQHWVPLRPTCALEHTNPLVAHREVTVHYSRKEKRQPWVNMEGQRYNNPGVLSPTLAGQKIRVEFDRSDLRQLKAFTLKGRYLGVLLGPASWRRFRYGATTRKRITQYLKEHKIRTVDSLGAYFDYLVTHSHKSKIALELVRVYREFGAYATPLPATQAASPTLPVTPPRPRSPKDDATTPIPTWSPTLVHRRNV